MLLHAHPLVCTNAIIDVIDVKTSFPDLEVSAACAGEPLRGNVYVFIPVLASGRMWWSWLTCA